MKHYKEYSFCDYLQRMIDIKDYRANPQKYIDSAVAKNATIDRTQFDKLDTKRRELLVQVESTLAHKNTVSKQIQDLKKSWQNAQESIAAMQTLKQDLSTAQDELQQVEHEWMSIVRRIPNPIADDVPVWKTDEENVVLEKVNPKPEFSFEPQPHRDILEKLWYLDQERAVKLSGSRFQILRGPLAQLQIALTHRVSQKLADKWFEVTIVPQLVKEDAMYTTWFLPNDSTNLYRVNPKSPTPQEDWEEDDLWLIGTAEVPLITQHQNEVFAKNTLPKRYVWVSSCFRREAWTYWRDTKWLIRLHQFEKVEMVSFVRPEDSIKEHEMIREIEEEIFTELGIHFQRVLICSWDLGDPAAKKYDLEAWLPGIGKYVEVTSASNTTDYQTRRGNIKYTTDEWKKLVCHSLNGTALAMSRALAAIVETYQQEDGSVRIPEVLKVYFTWKETL